MSKDKLLHIVREGQAYAAVVAEAFLFAALVISSADASQGGAFANIPWVMQLWSWTLAIGLDTCMLVSWVRVRLIGWRISLIWALPLAIGLSFIAFQTVAIQMLQQSMHLDFQQALSNLGIDINFLVYARSFVAVMLGAILALTNVEDAAPAIAPIAPPAQPRTEIAEDDKPQLQAIAPPQDPQSEIAAPPPAISDDAILQFMQENPGMLQKDIAAQLQIQPSRISRAKKKIAQ